MEDEFEELEAKDGPLSIARKHTRTPGIKIKRKFKKAELAGSKTISVDHSNDDEESESQFEKLDGSAIISSNAQSGRGAYVGRPESSHADVPASNQKLIEEQKGHQILA